MFDPTAKRRAGPGRGGERLAAGRLPDVVPTPDGVVFEAPGARVAFRRDAVRRLRVPALATATLPVSAALIAVGGPLLVAAGAVAAAVGSVGAIATAFAWARVRRFHRIVSRHRWSAYAV